MAASLFPDSLFQAVKADLMAEYRPGTTITSDHGAENRALKATERVLGTIGKFYEEALANGD